MCSYLEEDVHMLPWSVFFKHRIRVFPHHVIDGFDNVHHLLERGHRSTQCGNQEVKLFWVTVWGFLSPLRMKVVKGTSSADERALESKLKGIYSGSLLPERGQWKILFVVRSSWVACLFLSIPQWGVISGIWVDIFMYWSAHTPFLEDPLSAP